MNQSQIEQLIEKSKKNDSVSFGILVSEYQQSAFRLAFRIICNYDEAMDIVQDSFVKAWINIDKYNTKFKFSTWIYKIVCNTCYDKIRYDSKRKIKNLDLGEINIPVISNAESDIINNEIKDLILKTTKELTPKQKLVFILKDIEELEVEEIVQITGLSPAKIKSNLYLARKYIRTQIDL